MLTTRRMSTAICAGICAAAILLPPEDCFSGEPIRNLFANGSFELGLGAEPFYPGWQPPGKRTIPLPGDVPPLPIVDETVAHSGKRSLKFSAIPGDGRAILAFQSPNLPENVETHFSLWARASRPGVKLIFGNCPPPKNGPLPFHPKMGGELSGEWLYLECKLPKLTGVAHIRLEVLSGQAEPFDVWIDDICWTQGEHKGMSRSGPVDIVLLPEPRNGIRFAEDPVELTWCADADVDRDVQLKLTLSDLTRDGATSVAWTGKARIRPEGGEGAISLGKIKRGAYLAELEVSDASSGEVLGIGRERFTVMTNLKKVPPPIEFDIGSHYGFGFGRKTTFNWRGYWSADGFFAANYQVGFRILRQIWGMHTVEPEEGRFTWDTSNMDRVIQAAHRNGCSTIPCLCSPFGFDRKKYQEFLKDPSSAPDRWMFLKAKDISEESARSAPMGYSHDPAERKALFAPDPEWLAHFFTAFAERYKGKIAALELGNEINLYIKTKAAIEHYFKVVYAVVKNVAPDMPVLMNQTLDYDADGNGFTGQFFALGGMEFCDGFTHHPYSCPVLKSRGLEAVRILERIEKKYSTPEKSMMLGMTEIHSLGAGSFMRGEGVQRSLLDWSIGCRWSAGMVLDAFTFYEGSPRDFYFRRGPFAYGVGAVGINALYALLGGSRVTDFRRVELDDNVLIACFENPSAKPGQPRYTAAITAADFPTQVGVLNVNLEGLKLTAFDWCGEPTDLPSRTQIRLTPDCLYLQSPDPALFDRLRTGRVTWTQELFADFYDKKVHTNAQAYSAAATTGLPLRNRENCGFVSDWSILKPLAVDADKSPRELGLVDADGNVTLAAKRVRPFSSKLPYTFLAKGGPKSAPCHYANSVIYAGRDEETSSIFTATGPATIWLNGKQVADFSDLPYELVGKNWRSLRMPFKKGVNNVLVRVASNGNPGAFAFHANGAAVNPDEAAVSGDGFIRKWNRIGPWQNERDSAGNLTGNEHPFSPEKAPTQPDFTMCEVSAFGTPRYQHVGNKMTSKKRLPLVWYEEHSATSRIGHGWPIGVSYAFAVVEAPEDMDCFAALGSDDGYALWINGKELGRLSLSRACRRDETKLPVRLQKGRNTILFKIEDKKGGGGFMLRFVDKSGTPILLKVVD